MKSRNLSLMASLILANSFLSASAKTILPERSPDTPHWCGTRFGTLQEKTQRHEYNLSVQKLTGQANVKRADQDMREIAVIENDGAISPAVKAVDIANRTLTFRTNSGGGYDLSGASGGPSSTPGSAVALPDDGAVRQGIGFSFPFAGRSFTEVFVNSDGNLTFTQGDADTSERDLSRFLGPLPRIAAFFQDLDPSAATGRGRVLVESTGSAFTVTWDAVPRFDTTQNNTFQIVLRPDGSITMAFGALGSNEAVVGVSPGGQPASVAVDLSSGNGRTTANQAMVEVFSQNALFDDIALAKAFYRTHGDGFNFLVYFSDFPVNLPAGAFAYYNFVQNTTEGLGMHLTFPGLGNSDRFNDSRFYGSAGKLEGLLNMNVLAQYGTDPNAPLLGSNSTMDIFGQEAGHRWLAFVHFNDRGRPSNLLLGRDISHWNFCMDSDASDMEGNDWRDNGNGTFTTVQATDRFSLLDQYVMGLVPPSEVPPTFYLPEGCTSELQRSRGPEVGVTVTSSKRTVTIQEIVAANGPRLPAAATAPKSWNMAFVLVTAAGATPSNRSLRKIDNFRRAWNQYFKAATDNRGTMITTLDGGAEDTEPFPEDDGGGGGDDGGGGCGTLTNGGPSSGGPAGGLGALLLASLVGLSLATQRKRVRWN